ncbi:MAG TPA: sulfotransferase domain-containing protein [Anaerolineales bacterium]
MPSTNPIRRLLREPIRNVQAVLRWKRLSFDDAPPMFGNSKPKSGSHLLVQILGGFPRILPYRYVISAPVRTIAREGGRRSPAVILSDIKRIPRGVIGWGYVEATPENTAFLCQPDRVNYFVYRDPRDMLISQVFYATDMQEGHGMHEYYASLSDFGARLKVAITGIDQDGMYMVSVKERYEGVFRWLERSDVLSLRFEDLINQREASLNRMLDQVEKTGYSIPMPRERALGILLESIQPEKSRTFRSGKTGSWREYFTDAHKKLFKDVAGDLLVRLGYEPNNDW